MQMNFLCNRICYSIFQQDPAIAQQKSFISLSGTRPPSKSMSRGSCARTIGATRNVHNGTRKARAQDSTSSVELRAGRNCKSGEEEIRLCTCQVELRTPLLLLPHSPTLLSPPLCSELFILPCRCWTFTGPRSVFCRPMPELNQGFSFQTVLLFYWNFQKSC